MYIYIYFYCDSYINIGKNSMFSPSFFEMSYGLVPNRATLTIVWFLQVQRHFFMFRVFCFLTEKNKQKQSENRSQINAAKFIGKTVAWDPK